MTGELFSIKPGTRRQDARATTEAAAAQRNDCKYACQCGKSHVVFSVSHYDRYILSCGQRVWALQPLRNVMTLLEKAKLYRRTSKAPQPSADEIELALAWLRDEISTAGAVLATGKGSGAVYCRLAVALRQAHRDGLLIIKTTN